MEGGIENRREHLVSKTMPCHGGDWSPIYSVMSDIPGGGRRGGTQHCAGIHLPSAPHSVPLPPTRA